MPEPTLTAAAGAVVAKKAIDLAVADLYAAAKESVGFVIKKTQIRNKIKHLEAHMVSVRQVKTLWQLDKAVDLRDFYCDSHVLIHTQARRRKKIRPVRRKVIGVQSLSQNNNHVVLQGIAGQGKSILMRYLCSQEFAAGKRVPILVELRRIQKGETLLDHIFRSLAVLGFNKIDEKLFTALAKTGRLLFLLDAFDEVPEDNKTTILNEIEYYAGVGTSQIIVSARPDSGIETSTLFEVVRLDDLRGNEYKTFIHRLTDDKDFATELIDRISKHHGDINELLCTPLLVTLLLISYRSFQELPTHLSEFYERIFQDLLQRHDGTKPGYRRKRRCELSDTEYRKLFDCLCYRSKTLSNHPIKYDDIHRVTKDALARCCYNSDADNYLTDIIKVTCLLLRDGDECRFIHNSVQEYYAASYIAHRSFSVAQVFYSHCLRLRYSQEWRQELLFLSEIDKYRYYRMYHLPLQCEILGISSDDIPEREPAATISRAHVFFDNILLFFSPTEKNGRLALRGLRSVTIPFSRNVHLHSLSRIDYSPVVKALASGQLAPSTHELSRTPWPYDEEREKRQVIVSISDILNAKILSREILSITQKVLHSAFEQLQDALSYIDHEDSCDLMLPDI